MPNGILSVDVIRSQASGLVEKVWQVAERIGVVMDLTPPPPGLHGVIDQSMHGRLSPT